jgi:hypothetical protein
MDALITIEALFIHLEEGTYLGVTRQFPALAYGQTLAECQGNLCAQLSQPVARAHPFIRDALIKGAPGRPWQVHHLP